MIDVKLSGEVGKFVVESMKIIQMNELYLLS